MHQTPGLLAAHAHPLLRVLMSKLRGESAHSNEASVGLEYGLLARLGSRERFVGA